ncbi:excalibur calcium-binding domain-containing protein [Alteromonadaceae bacterium BrNp21-10]|nr:excalibur calcium-binding domain-containing protein [Alteromonadaceae bacterium BrNp21-10]
MLKKLLIIALIFIGGWHYYQKSTQPLVVSTPTYSAPQSLPTPKVEPIVPYNFSCDGRQHCSQMTSRAEAEYFIKHCPDTKMDGDNDGIPCENDSRF